jgi:exodeoxyribonuclease-3
VRLVTWNVNSIGARMPRLLELLETVAPDVVCLQETKVEADRFPEHELAAAGYGCVHHSGGRWAGVAVLTRDGRACSGEVRGLPGERNADEARWVETDVDGVRVCSVYVVNGRAVGSEWFADKLAFLDAMVDRARVLRERGEPFVIAGDFNVTRDDRDVYDPAAFAGETHVTPDERGRIDALLEAGGLVDAYRALHDGPEDRVHTWWDYRAGHFHKGLGLRIDLVLASAGLRVVEHAMLRDFRKGTKPSDHAPVLVELAAG